MTARNPSAPVAANAAVSIHFEPNRGQASPGARYVARNAACTLELGDEGLSLRFPTGELHLVLRNRAATSMMVPEKSQPALAAYFVGDDASKWRTAIPAFGAVRHRGFYSGTDWVVYGDGPLIGQDFILAPHASLAKLRFSIIGADRARIAADGSLVLGSRGHEVRLRAPTASQVSGNWRQPVTVRFVLDAVCGEVGFALVTSSIQELVLDPVLMLSTSLDLAPAAELTARLQAA